MRVTYVVSAEIPDSAPASARWELTERLEAASHGGVVVDVTGSEARDFNARLRVHLSRKIAKAGEDNGSD